MVSKSVAIGGNLAVTALLALILFSSKTQLQKMDYQGVQGENLEKDFLRFLVIGDYGYQGLEGQQAVGKKMSSIVEDQQVEFILGTGDNFYNPDGVKSVLDENWDLHWSKIYKSSGRIKDIPWYSTQGNHDYNTQSLAAQFNYRSNGWKFGSLFWSHSHLVQNKKITFIHVDTSPLAYGPQGQGASKPMMKPWFDRLGITDDQQSVKMVEDMIEINKDDSDWMIGVGHHPIGGDCIEQRNTYKINQVFLQNNITSYIHGHVHSLGHAYNNKTGISYFLSGAGGQNLEACTGGVEGAWTQGDVYGFLIVDVNVVTDTINGTYYFTQDLTNWQNYSTQPAKRRVLK